LRAAIKARNHHYNRQITLIEELEAEGKVTVLRPQHPIEVGRTEQDTSKLLSLYNEGSACAEALEIINPL
jgi:predicted patatin/cPLA2 family phospholipase